MADNQKKPFCPMSFSSPQFGTRHCEGPNCQWWLHEKANCAVVVMAKWSDEMLKRIGVDKRHADGFSG